MNKINIKKGIIEKSLIFLILVFFILNPYTIFGKPGALISFLLIAYSIIKKTYKLHTLPSIHYFIALLLIGTWGSFISYINGIGQINHLYAVISLIIVTLTSEAVWKLCKNLRIDFYEFLHLCLLVIVFNSLIIILESNDPAFRNLIEGFLIPAGNIDWASGFRYRGISSSGGAGLSIVTPVAFVCLLYLYDEKKINFIFSIIYSIILILALLNIGRTGLMMLPLVFGLYFMYSLKRIIRNRSGLARVFLFFLVINVIIISNIDFLFDYLDEKFGVGYSHYAIGFALEGEQGLRSEGTTSTLLNYISVIPTTFPEVITGYGFYGGSFFSPWTDSGYARMFLSVGIFLGFIFYLLLYFIYVKKIKNHKFLLYTILIILLISEVKEPLLYSGNAARFFIIILIFSFMEKNEKISSPKILTNKNYYNITSNKQ